jgi:hypothetical protein
MLASIFVNAQSMRCLDFTILTLVTETTPSGAYLFPVEWLVHSCRRFSSKLTHDYHKQYE